MFTVTVYYKESIGEFHKVKYWRMFDKYLLVSYGEEHYDFIFNDKATSINIKRNN